MCGRYRNLQSWMEMHGAMERFLGSTRETPLNIGPREQVRPTTNAPVIRMQDGAPILANARWWLVPWFYKGKPLKGWKATTFNARSEGVKTSASFRQCFAQRLSGNSVFLNVLGQSYDASDFTSLSVAGVPEPTEGQYWSEVWVSQVWRLVAAARRSASPSHNIIVRKYLGRRRCAPATLFVRLSSNEGVRCVARLFKAASTARLADNLKIGPRCKSSKKPRSEWSGGARMLRRFLRDRAALL